MFSTIDDRPKLFDDKEDGCVFGFSFLFAYDGGQCMRWVLRIAVGPKLYVVAQYTLLVSKLLNNVTDCTSLMIAVCCTTMQYMLEQNNMQLLQCNYNFTVMMTEM